MKKIIYPLIAAIVIGLDQLTKYLVRANMQPGDRIPVIGDWFSIYYVQNTGTAFSMFSGNKFITIVLTSAIIVACLVFIIIEVRKGSRVLPLLLTAICAGGIGNMIDRLTLGYVTDMISCWSFAVFNVADIAVTCGCFLLVFYILIAYKDEAKAEAGKTDRKESSDE